jgi:ABC-2 type transport system ATP-binding protein
MLEEHTTTTSLDGRLAKEPTPPSSLIVTESLTKRYGATLAVDALDLRVGAGEIYGFLGPNGAGKTTTIKMLVGLEPPTSGRVLIGGHDVQEEPLQAKRLIGYLPDQPYVYDKLTAWEFLHFVAGLYEVPPGLAQRRAAELLRVFGLLEVADSLLESYSHGMRQKTVLAAALLHDPEVLLLDEPTVGLDPRTARLIHDILRQLSRRGRAVFLSTHILEIAERMCDRVAIIHHGRVIAEGSVSEVMRLAQRSGTLEDVFLELTGGPEYTEIARVLQA